MCDADRYNLARWRASGWTRPTAKEIRERVDDARDKLCQAMQGWDHVLPS